MKIRLICKPDRAPEYLSVEAVRKLVEAGITCTGQLVVPSSLPANSWREMHADAIVEDRRSGTPAA